MAARWERYLERWTTAGLIEPSTAERVRAYEAEQEKTQGLRRQEGEEFWVEVTIPKRAPPHPIRLGVKKGDGPIIPLALR